jgi:hypothetical protein
MIDRQRRGARFALVAVLAVLAGLAATAAATSAAADGVSRDNLVAHGWTCVPFAPANRLSCFNPGLGRPFPGNPDPRPAYAFVAFDLTSGDFIYTGNLIRGDLYAGQPCEPGGDPYVFRAAIGYYECVHK